MPGFFMSQDCHRQNGNVLRRGFYCSAEKARRHGRRAASLQAADNAKVMRELQFRHVGGTPIHAGAPHSDPGWPQN